MEMDEETKKGKEWLSDVQGMLVFEQLNHLLQECCDKLNVTNKLDESLRLIPSSPAQAEKLTLVPRNGSDALRVNVTMLAENIIQTDIAIRYPKVPGGVLRSVAHPDVQWKLQQVQDAGNHCVRALTLISERDQMTPVAFRMAIESVSESICAARSSLCLPRKRSLLELCHFRPTRCFTPSLPSDLLLSYYVSSSRIVCAAYQLCPAPRPVGQSSSSSSSSSSVQQSLNVIQAECHLPYLAQVLQLLNAALLLAQQLRYKLTVLGNCSADSIESSS